MGLSFQDFLEEISGYKKQYDCCNGEIVLNLSGEKELIAKYIPKIKKEDWEWQWGDNGVEIWFRLYFVLEGNEDRKAELELYVYGLKRQTEIEREEIQDLIGELYKDKWVKNKGELTKLFERYIRYYIKDYLNRNSHIFTNCGWKKENGGKEFYSLTKRGGFNFSFIEDMFGNAVFKKHRSGEDFSAILFGFNQCKELYDFLFSDPALIGIFAYTIHALVWDYGCEYNKEYYEGCLGSVENRDALFFSACIYGKDTDKAKVIANILCNVFQEPKTSWTIISTKHHVSATSLKTTVDKMKKYSSVPIIVTSKTDHMMKSSKIVKELYHNREAMKLFVYPVFINDTPINADEIANFNVDRVLLPFSIKDRETAHKLHEQMAVLLFSFVLYLRDMSMNSERNFTLNKEYGNLLDARKDFEEEWVEKNLPLFLLYAALKFFCDFIKQFQKEEGEKLLSLYRDNIVNIGQTEYSKRQTQGEQPTPEQEMGYLLRLHQLIQKSLKQKEEWLFEGNEPRGEKERCYYMQAVWYEKFSENVKKEKMPKISQRKMIAILKKYGFLKQQKNSTANVLQRDKKPYYTILADAFTEAVNQWNISSQ